MVKGHSKNPGYIAGDHWVECSRCGFDYRQSHMKREWTGVIVCQECWEPRHPQDFVRATEDDQTAKGLVNPQSTENYIETTFGETPWDISTAQYDSKSLDVSTEAFNPWGLAFSSDGTKAYVVGTTDDTIYQYTLSTAWDISTGSYASKSLSVASEDGSPISLFFSSDGTKAYILGFSNDTIYQYTLSTAWDISTGSYASKSFDVSSQTTLPYSLYFSPDGTKAYVGNSTSIIYQYNLSTPWDISTANYTNKSFNVINQEDTTRGIFFSSDGVYFYVIGTAGSSNIYQYELLEVWNISTAKYTGKSFNMFTEEQLPTDLFLNSVGVKLYVIGTQNKSIYQYTLKTDPTAIPSGTFTL
jgi:hypothetical protein